MSTRSPSSMLLIVLAGFCCMSLSDSISKTLAGVWPGTAFAAWRYLAATIGLGLLVTWREGRAGWRMTHPALQAGRGFAAAISGLCFILAVMRIPLADATAIYFLSPVLTAGLTVLIFRERMAAGVWLAIGLALAGVLVVLRPGLDFAPARLLPLGTAVFMGVLVILNRKAAGLASPLASQLQANLFACALLVPVMLVAQAIGGPAFHVPMPDGSIVARILAAAVLATTGHFLIYLGTTALSPAVVAPLTYVQLLVAGAIGWIWFDNPPNAFTWTGAALIVAAGFVLFRSQRRVDVVDGER